MRLSRDSTIDTHLIVAGLLLGVRGLMSVAGNTAVAFAQASSSGSGLELLRALQYYPSAPAFQLLVAAMMVVRPNFIRACFLWSAPGSVRFFSSESREFWLRSV